MRNRILQGVTSIEALKLLLPVIYGQHKGDHNSFFDEVHAKALTLDPSVSKGDVESWASILGGQSNPFPGTVRPAFTLPTVNKATASVQQPAHEPMLPKDEAEIVARYNAEYFVAPCGGAVYVYREREGGDPIPMSKAGFLDLNANDIIGSGSNSKSAASIWFRSRGRRQYLGGVVFDPTGRSGSDAYNLFNGYAVAPKPGNCEPILDHIENVLCAGSASMTAYVLDWHALMFQHPEVRPDTALVFQSGEGAGKGIYASVLSRVLGRKYVYKAPSMNALVTQYNAFLQQCILVIGEEAVWSGDTGKSGILKDLVTAPELRIEVKLGPVYSVPSYLHAIFFTNEQWAVPAGNDARRWVVNRASDHRKGDSAYFTRLAAWADNPDNLSAFMHFLLTRDISKFNPRIAPKTEALLQQKLLSLCEIGQYVYHALDRGSLSQHDDKWACDVPCADLVAAIATTIANKHELKRLETRVGMRLKEIFGSDMQKSRVAVHGMRKYVFRFPALEQARASFERWIGQSVTWSEG